MILESAVGICKLLFLKVSYRYSDTLGSNNVHSRLLTPYFLFGFEVFGIEFLKSDWIAKKADETGELFICLILSDATWRNYETVLNKINTFFQLQDKLVY